VSDRPADDESAPTECETGWAEPDPLAGDPLDDPEFSAWVARVRTAEREAAERGEPVPYVPGPPGLIFLNVDDPLLDTAPVVVAEPEGMSWAAKRRRALADRLAEVIVAYPPDDERGAAMVGSLSLPAKVRYARVVQQALTEAPAVAEASEPDAVKVSSGWGNVAVRLHGPAWSLVFRLSPFPEPVLFVTDEMPEQARRVDTDLDWLPEIGVAIAAVVRELSRYSLGGDKYVAPRLPR